MDVVAPSFCNPDICKRVNQHYDYGIDEVEICDADIEEVRAKHHMIILELDSLIQQII